LSKDKDSVNVAFNATYNYDAFGNPTESIGGEATNNPLRYNGQYHDDETGLIYLRNRYYDPSIGRFTQEDPAKDGTNWYVYCENNPVNMVDPGGLRPRPYEPEKWNDAEYDGAGVQNRTNCYAYALDFCGEFTYGDRKGEQFEVSKPQPGSYGDVNKKHY